MRSSDGVLVAEGLLHIVNLVELVLEVDSAEGEGHNTAETDSEGFRAVVVALDVVAEGEAGDETDYPAGDADEAAEDALMGMMVVAEFDEDAVGTAKVQEDQHSSD